MPLENDVPVVDAGEASESIQVGYDRIAHPETEQAELPPKQPTVETPPEPAYTDVQIKDALAQVARIPDLEKRLRDDGGRYGALKQTLEQLQQRISTTNTSAQVDVEAALAGIKEDFGDYSSVYLSLKNAFSAIAGVGGRGIDPDEISKVVEARIAAAKQAEITTLMNSLTEVHPTWQQDRETPEFKEWMETLTEKERKKFKRSMDVDHVAEKLDEFKEWKAAKVTKPNPAPTPPAKPSQRLTRAVLPTNGTKPKVSGESDPKASIRAGYERVASARMR